MYSDVVMDHFQNPRNVGKPERYTVKGVAGDPSAGPFMLLYLEIDGERIGRTGFSTYGCGPAIASGSLVSEMVKGMRIAEAGRIDSGRVLERLGGLPLGKQHCAELAVSALRDALSQVAP